MGVKEPLAEVGRHIQRRGAKRDPFAFGGFGLDPIDAVVPGLLQKDADIRLKLTDAVDAAPQFEFVFFVFERLGQAHQRQAQLLERAGHIVIDKPRLAASARLGGGVCGPGLHLSEEYLLVGAAAADKLAGLAGVLLQVGRRPRRRRT